MAIFETKKIIDANGRETVEKAGPFTSVKMEKKGDNVTCLSKRDILNISSRQTCVTTPNTVVNNK